MKDGKPIAISFVCMGNICRSPTAETVMRHLVKEAGLEGQIVVDSAGTGDWHVGEERDRRTRAVASRRGMPITGEARQFTRHDFDRFDLVLALDEDNARALRRLAPNDEDAGQGPPAARLRARRRARLRGARPVLRRPRGLRARLRHLPRCVPRPARSPAQDVPPRCHEPRTSASRRRRRARQRGRGLHVRGRRRHQRRPPGAAGGRAAGVRQEQCGGAAAACSPPRRAASPGWPRRTPSAFRRCWRRARAFSCWSTWKPAADGVTSTKRSAAAWPRCIAPARPASASITTTSSAACRRPMARMATWAEFYRERRLEPQLRLADRRSAGEPGHAPRLRARLAPPRGPGRPARAAGAPARRSVGRQRHGRRARSALPDRPGGVRRPSRGRPGDDASLRRLRRPGLRRLRGSVSAAARQRGPRARSTSSTSSWCTSTCSAARTWPPSSTRSPAWCRRMKSQPNAPRLLLPRRRPHPGHRHHLRRPRVSERSRVSLARGRPGSREPGQLGGWPGGPAPDRDHRDHPAPARRGGREPARPRLARRLRPAVQPRATSPRGRAVWISARRGRLAVRDGHGARPLPRRLLPGASARGHGASPLPERRRRLHQRDRRAPRLDLPPRRQALERVRTFVEQGLRDGVRVVLFGSAFEALPAVVAELARAGHRRARAPAHRRRVPAPARRMREPAAGGALRRQARPERGSAVAARGPQVRRSGRPGRIPWRARGGRRPRTRPRWPRSASSTASRSATCPPSRELLAAIEATGAREVALVRGPAEAVATALRERGVDAYPLGPPRR